MHAVAETPGIGLPKTWPALPWVPLPENRAAQLAVRRLARALAAEPLRCAANPLLLHGPPGTGKTLLANAVHEFLAAQRSVTRIAAADWAPYDADDRLADRSDCDLLIVEDVQHLPARSADEFTATLDRRCSRRLATLLTANAGPAGLTELPARLTSRLCGGLVVALETLAPASRREFLRTLAKRQGWPVEEDLVQRLADATPGSARQLAAALANAVAEPNQHEPARERPSIEMIVQRIAREFRFHPSDLRGPDRQPQVNWARHVSMYLARRLTDRSLAQIGEYYHRDHSTVRHACQKVAAALNADPATAGLLNQLETELA